MRLLVSCIPYDGGKSGISVYVREVVAALAAQGHGLTLLCEPGEEENFLGHERREGREGREGSLVFAPSWTRRPALSMLWHLFVLPFWIWRHRRDFDGFVICAANRRVCAWYPLPTAATVHDLANFHIPGKYSRSRMFYLAHVLPFFAKKAQHLVAVSGATKADMVKYWHCREDQVTVLYNGLRTSDFGLRGDGRRRPGPGGQTSDVRSLLYISRIEHPAIRGVFATSAGDGRGAPARNRGQRLEGRRGRPRGGREVAVFRPYPVHWLCGRREAGVDLG